MSFEDRAMQSNLECFLRRTTPIVPYRLLPKSEARNQSQLWYPWERDSIEFFTLADLWSRYDEWSAYGAGVPIRLSSGESLIQYYVPYLSAVQIYTSSSSIRSFREDAESGDSETWYSFSDSWSDDSENEKQWRWDGNSSEDGGIEPDALGHLNRLGHLYFQYFERSAPYARVPLMDKIGGLSQTYPGLLSLRSVDLAPASWMAVSWYPIYHIPMGRTIKDLSTCFLTYHTLSSSFQDMDLDAEMEIKEKKRKEGEGIALPPFGLATYKMQGNVWVSSGERERLKSLLRVADSWLKQLKVQHHDFNYFGRFQHVYELR